MENMGIPREIFLEKISGPTKKVLDAIQSQNKEEVIDTANTLIEGIDFCMNKTWVSTNIFHNLNNLYLWISSIKKKAQKAG